MSDKNWIKLNRKILGNVIWQDKEPFDKRSAWIDLLMLANHADHDIIQNGKIIHVKRGDVNRSILQLASRWSWSRNKVVRFLDLLDEARMIARVSTTDGTTLTIVNYAKYQGERATVGATVETTVETRVGATVEQGSKQGSEHIQERKEYKKKVNNVSLRVPETYDDILNNPLLSEEAKTKFMEIRKKARDTK